MRVRRATKNDLVPIMTVVNKAYLVERGDSGVGFKKEGQDRFNSIEEVEEILDHLWVIDIQRNLVGVIGIKGDESKVCIGPLAVHPSFQGRGIARILLDHAEEQSEVCTAGVISCRTDMIRIYEKRGYKKKREYDVGLVVPERCLSRSGLSFVDYEKHKLEISMSKPSDYEIESVMEIVNDAYKVELGNSGLSFKSADRFVTVEDALQCNKNLWVAKMKNEIVGVIGISVEDGIADLGPIAVSPAMKGQGVGSWMLRYAETLHPITMVGVVSCRADILPFYTKRGYKTCKEEDFDTAGIANVADITRRGLKYVKKQKINKVEKDMIKVMPADFDDIQSIVAVVNSAYQIELGDTGIAFKNADRFLSVQDALDLKDDLHVAKIGIEIIGVIAITVMTDSAILGPLAVSPGLQGYGVGRALLDFAESLHRVTEVGVVSCRTDLLTMYEKRGYREERVNRLEDEGTEELKWITRDGLSMLYMRKINWEK